MVKITEVFLFVFFCGIALCVVRNVCSAPTVNLEHSQIIGKTITLLGRKLDQYLGIPYAKPPVGRLRFMKPKPIHKYPPVLKALTNPPACHQYTENPYPWYVNSKDKSEDCLYLNIWTPSEANAKNLKAVMYWIYGGGFRYGSIRSEIYTAVPLASMGDIIVVTVNYRLGTFGFLTSGTTAAPGNAGLWDILEGLRWVNIHIEAFGGDSTRITIAGESAGSIAVGLLSVSPLARGLYARQIMESGSPAYRLADNNTQNIALSQVLAKMVGCANDTFTIEEYPKYVVLCLKDVDAVVLSKADFLLAPYSSSDLIPQYGDEILPRDPRKSIIEGKFRCTDLLIGNNGFEGSYQVASKNPAIFGFFGQKDPQINKTFGETMIRTQFSTFPDPESIVKHYLPANLPEDSYDEVRYQVCTSSGDISLVCPDIYYAEKCAEKGNRVYFYFWTHRPSNTPWAPWMGVAHFSEVQFVFGQPILHPNRYEASEVRLSRQLIDIWTNFVKTGKPNISWPLYSKENHVFKYLGPCNVTGKNGIGPHLGNCNFLRSNFGF